MDSTLYQMLLKSAEADKAKAQLSLELLGNKAAGIGDHSTEDFYKNAEEALQLLIHDKKIREQEQELRTLLNFRYGHRTWEEMIQLRRKIKA